jgi:DNA polymerase III alpha subunit
MIYNDYGHQVYQESDLIQLLISGDSVDGCTCEDSPDIVQFINANENAGLQTTISIYSEPSTPVLEYHKFLSAEYEIPDEYKNLDLVKYVFDLVEKYTFDYDIELVYQRIEEELALFYEYDLENYIRSVIFIIDAFTKNNIIHGCGRGSSVASFILYLIGVHYIDPIKYDINISEFLRK